MLCLLINLHLVVLSSHRNTRPAIPLFQIRNSGNKHQNDPLVSAETVRHESTYIILFLTPYNNPINDDKSDDLYTSSPCLTRPVFVLLMTQQPIDDAVTMTRQLWHDHVNNEI